MKEVVLETAEDDIEEIPPLPSLPSVVRRDEGDQLKKMTRTFFFLVFFFPEWIFAKAEGYSAGHVLLGSRSAFTEPSLSSETEEEASMGADSPSRPGSSRYGTPSTTIQNV